MVKCHIFRILYPMGLIHCIFSYKVINIIHSPLRCVFSLSLIFLFCYHQFAAPVLVVAALKINYKINHFQWNFPFEKYARLCTDTHTQTHTKLNCISIINAKRRKFVTTNIFKYIYELCVANNKTVNSNKTHMAWLDMSRCHENETSSYFMTII